MKRGGTRLDPSAGMGRRGCPRSAALHGHPLSARATVVDIGRIPGGVRDFRHGRKSCMRVEEVLGTVRTRLVSRALCSVSKPVLITGDLQIREMDLTLNRSCYDYRDYFKSPGSDETATRVRSRRAVFNVPAYSYDLHGELASRDGRPAKMI